MPAPPPSGAPTVRALTSTEAGAWLRVLLRNPQIADPEIKLTSPSHMSKIDMFKLSRQERHRVWR